MDPSYIHVANETGGQPLFLQRSEAAKAFHLMRESTRNNRSTILWATGILMQGPQEFMIPLDTATKRVTFAFSVDTKGDSLVLIRPSGAGVTPSEHGVEMTDLNCGRIVTIAAPETGNWKARVVGSGRYWISVQAESEIYFVSVEFVRRGGRPGHEGLFKIPGQPLADGPATLKVHLSSGAISTAEFKLVTERGETIQNVRMETESANPDDREFVGTLELPSQPFRVAVTGLDTNGKLYQRFFHSLFHAETVEVSPSTDLAELPPGRTTPVTFTVRNVGPPSAFRVVVADSKRFVSRVEPQELELGSGESGKVVVDMAVPPGTAPGTGGDLTITVTSTSVPATQNGTSTHFSVSAARNPEPESCEIGFPGMAGIVAHSGSGAALAFAMKPGKKCGLVAMA